MARIRTARTVRYNRKRAPAENVPRGTCRETFLFDYCSQAVTPREARGTGLVSIRTKFCRVAEKCCAGRGRRGLQRHLAYI